MKLYTEKDLLAAFDAGYLKGYFGKDEGLDCNGKEVEYLFREYLKAKEDGEQGGASACV